MQMLSVNMINKDAKSVTNQNAGNSSPSGANASQRQADDATPNNVVHENKNNDDDDLTPTALLSGELENLNRVAETLHKDIKTHLEKCGKLFRKEIERWVNSNTQLENRTRS
eukprot:2535888-Lingulodinium_polyedra.AAC.1